MGKGMTPSQICIAVLPSTRWIPPSLKFAQICWLARCALQLLCRDLHPAKWYKELKEGFTGGCLFTFANIGHELGSEKISFAFANPNCYIVSWEQIVWAASKRTRTISRGIFFWEILMSIFTTKMCLLVCFVEIVAYLLKITTDLTKLLLWFQFFVHFLSPLFSLKYWWWRLLLWRFVTKFYILVFKMLILGI